MKNRLFGTYETDWKLLAWSEIAFFCQIILEGLVTGLWYSSILGKNTTLFVSCIVMVLIFLISTYLARILAKQTLDLLSRAIIFIIWISAAELFSLKLLLFSGEPLSIREMLAQSIFAFGASPKGYTAFAHIFVILVMIIFSVFIARTPSSKGRYLGHFRTGLLLFLIYGVLFYPQNPNGSLITFLAYLFVGLVGLTFDSIASMEESRRGRLPRFDLKRFAGLIGMSLGMILIIGITRLIFNDFIVALIVQALITILIAIMMVGITILSPVLAIVLEAAYKIGQKLMPEVFSQQQEAQIIQESIDEVATMGEESLHMVGELLKENVHVIMIAILIVSVIVLILLLKWKPWTRRIIGENLSTDSTQKVSLLPVAQQHKTHRRRRWLDPNQLIGAARIRRTYVNLMNLCTKLEHQRPEAVTPLEFIPEMETLFKGQNHNLMTITQGYIKIRYGELPEDQEAVEHVIQAWKEIERIGKVELARHRQLRRQLKKKK
jgi:hypothetical protein